MGELKRGALKKGEVRVLRFLEPQYDRLLSHAPKLQCISAELDMDDGELHSIARLLEGQGLIRTVTDSLMIRPAGRQYLRELDLARRRRVWRAVWIFLSGVLVVVLGGLALSWLRRHLGL